MGLANLILQISYADCPMYSYYSSNWLWNIYTEDTKKKRKKKENLIKQINVHQMILKRSPATFCFLRLVTSHNHAYYITTLRSTGSTCIWRCWQTHALVNEYKFRCTFSLPNKFRTTRLVHFICTALRLAFSNNI